MNYQTSQMINFVSQVVTLMITGVVMQVPVVMLQARPDEEPKSLEDFLAKLPFMPYTTRKEQKLPEYVYKLVRPEDIVSTMESSLSDYGDVLQEKIAAGMLAFMKGGDFKVTKRLTEKAWASDSVGWNASIEHIPTHTVWNIEVWASFEWRQPEKVDMTYTVFLPAGKQLSEDEWEIMPERDWDSGGFDLSFEGGKKAGSIIIEKYRK